MDFWQKLPQAFTVLAPMDDVTDNVFRQVVLASARPDIFFTEFVSADGLVHSTNKTALRKLDFTSREHPIVAQIWGNIPKNIEKAAKIVKKLGFDGIDINMGCPVRDVIKKGSGAGLIGQYDLAQEIIKAAKKGAGGIPVSIKTRLGIKQNIASSWTEFLLKQDISALTVHGRTAAQMSKAPADWEEIGKVVEIRNRFAPETKVIGNGDVKSYEEVLLKSKTYGVDGVMIGRGIFANLWVFDKSGKLHGKEDYLKMLLLHLNLFEKTWGKDKNFAVIKKFFKMYIKGFSGANSLRIKLMDAASFDEAKDILEKLANN